MTIGTYILVSLIKIVIAMFVLLTGVAYTTLAERKVVAHIQNRWGPSRVGPFGIWQPLADGLKFIFKEDITPPFAYKPLYLLAPVSFVDHGADRDCGDSDWPVGHDWRHSHAAADCRRQHRPADHSRPDLDRRIRSRAGGMVVQQQVLDAGQPARHRPDGEL